MSIGEFREGSLGGAVLLVQRLGRCVCVLGVRYDLRFAFPGDSCKPTSSAYLEPIRSLIADLCRNDRGGGSSPAYLEPIRNSLQKPIGGRQKSPKRGRSVLAENKLISMLKISVLGVFKRKKSKERRKNLFFF